MKLNQQKRKDEIEEKQTITKEEKHQPYVEPFE